jgi:D-alanyl-D-alanine carboxypeptidase
MNNYDYLVLVNKDNSLPNNWEESTNLVTVKNVFDEDIKVEKETYESYLLLKDDLLKEEIIIELDSAYRSVKEQEELYNRWSIEKGIHYVNKFVARPGYSEHHTGLAIDICIRKDNNLIYENSDMLKETNIFDKIHSKLSNYGFILRYTKGKESITGYSYEPWHLRYIKNREIAKEITDKKLTIEEYIK